MEPMGARAAAVVVDAAVVVVDALERSMGDGRAAVHIVSACRLTVETEPEARAAAVVASDWRVTAHEVTSGSSRLCPLQRHHRKDG